MTLEYSRFLLNFFAFSVYLWVVRVIDRNATEEGQEVRVGNATPTLPTPTPNRKLSEVVPWRGNPKRNSEKRRAGEKSPLGFGGGSRASKTHWGAFGGSAEEGVVGRICLEP